MTPTREEVILVARECGITFVPMVVDGIEYQFRHVRFHDPNCDSDEADCIERLAHHFYEAGAAAAREPLFTRPQTQAVPDGYALVPVEPTHDQTEAAGCKPGADRTDYVRIYKAMINAAQK